MNECVFRLDFSYVILYVNARITFLYVCMNGHNLFECLCVRLSVVLKTHTPEPLQVGIIHAGWLARHFILDFDGYGLQHRVRCVENLYTRAQFRLTRSLSVDLEWE
jgi:hypothetical protein